MSASAISESEIDALDRVRRIPSERHHLVTDNMKLVSWVMEKYFREQKRDRRLWAAIRDKAEWGLMIAAARYKEVKVTPERGNLVERDKNVEFSTYAVAMIRGYCFHAIRSHYRDQTSLKTVGHKVENAVAPHSDPLAGRRNDDRKQSALNWLRCLCAEDRQIVDMRFGITSGDPMMLDDIAAAFSCSRNRIQQKLKRAAKRLREHGARAGLALAS